VLVIDEAGMIGTRQMERIIAEAHKRGAKIVAVGDPEQLQAIEAGAAFRSMAERHGGVEITAIRRQQEEWQRDATRHLATGRTAQAIEAYADAGHVHAAPTREAASARLIDRWDQARIAHPQASQLILTHTNDAVQDLNQAARSRLRDAGALGPDVSIDAERGTRSFASGDRIMFLKNERSLGVKNGTVGTVQSLTATRMAVLLDDGRAVAFDIKDYAHLDHGYAATIHKAQGVTVDRVHVLASPGLDRHSAYVALSRHRTSVDLHYGQDDFADQGKLVRTLGRERGKDMASDYRDVQTQAPTKARSPFAGLNLKPPSPAERDLRSPLDRAADRHARIAVDILDTQAKGVAALPHQKTELIASRDAFNSLHPDGARYLEAAIIRDRSVMDVAPQRRGTALVNAMLAEIDLRAADQARADSFVQRWQGLERERRMLLGKYETTLAGEVGDRMIGMARRLERDPQLESILRNRKAQLGVPDVPGRSLSQGLMDMVGGGRSRGLNIGM
jgi:hypothetical protein